jgi:hypothetical protein
LEAHRVTVFLRFRNALIKATMQSKAAKAAKATKVIKRAMAKAAKVFLIRQ